LSWGNRWINGIRRGVHCPYWPMAVVAKSHFAKARDYVARFEQCAAQRARELGLDGCIGGHVHFLRHAPHWRCSVL
jgi:UDP-2,3-diacylglucosamine pyrophosphatase LpxH